MAWSTILGFVAIVAGFLFTPEIVKFARSLPSALGSARRGARLSPTTRRAPHSRATDPMFWVGHGGSVKRWE